MSSIAPYIAFPGNAREAFSHYHEVLGGELQVLGYDDVPMEGMPFTPPADAVAHAILITDAGQIAGGDAMPGGDYPLRDTAYSLLLTADSVDAGRAIIDAFVAAGGIATMPFERAPWGDFYGQVFDKFGVMWALSVPAANVELNEQ